MQKQWKQWQIVFSWSPKSLWTVTTGTKLKDTCFLEEKLWQTIQHIKNQRHHFASKDLSSQICGFSCSHIQMWELNHKEVLFSSGQSLSHVRLFQTPWTVARQASLSITNSQTLSKLISIKSVMLFNCLILCRPLLLLPPIPPSIRPPSIRVFSNESALQIRWPKYWNFSFNISPSNEYSGLMSFRMDWFDLLAVQGTLKNLLQHHSSKTSILRHSVFFVVYLLTE